MGLDSVELVMEMEETFGITIPDEEAEKIQTVGQAYRYILAHLGEPPLTQPGCLSAATFYRLRRQLMGGLRVERSRIRPDSALDDLIPKPGRRAAWRQFEEGLGWRLPKLRRPDWVDRLWVFLALGFLTAEVYAWGRLGGFAVEAVFFVLLFAAIGLLFLGVVLEEITRPLATIMPVTTIRGLVPMILATNLGTSRMNNPHGWTDAEVWDVLVALIWEQMGVLPEIIHEDTSFVNDLGVD
ncbi:MAG: hypothetical protein ACYC61_29610 [Isosphaeraceae bacterium]